MVWNVHAFKNFLLPTARLLAQDEPLDSGKASLTIILPAEGGARSKPARYASALEAVQGLYSFCARIHGEDPDALSVASFDSGSDMSFVLVGAAIVIGAIDRLLTNIYRTWAFHKQATEGANTENVLDKLAVYEEIHRLEKEKKIGREEAGHLRHQLKTAASSIVEAGVVTPDILKESHGDARQLMAPAPKLLLGPPAGAAQPVAPEEEALTPGISSLTPDERRLLENLLTKIKSHPGGTPDTVDPTAPFEPTDDGPRDTRRPDESEMSGGEGPSGAE
jgi:hypothetical protein